MFTLTLKGCGRPIVMLHGWGHSHQSLRPLADLLVEETQPILFDLPGFGQSERPQMTWSAAEYADAIVKQLDKLNIEKFLLLGHSFGGKVAICLAERYSERVDRLILISSSGLKEARSLDRQFKFSLKKLFSKAIKSIDRLFRKNYFEIYFVPKFASSDYKSFPKIRDILVRSVNEDLSHILPKINTPSLILWGEKDTQTPLKMGIQMAKLIPNAIFYSFFQHDHDLPHDDAGAQLSAMYILRFLRGGS